MPEPVDPSEGQRPSRKWTRRWILMALGALVAFLALEVVARAALGLGDPPLTIQHPTIEYLFAPNQDVLRFGNRVLINEYSMRSRSFPEKKTDESELRVLVMGDSIINGGNLTDHSRLATTLLEERLTQRLARPVVVMNVSAGSWGPPNQLAYLHHFGAFDADIAILEFSKNDLHDIPEFQPLNPNHHPTRKPWSAAFEGLVRYLPRYLPLQEEAVERTEEEREALRAVGTKALLDMLDWLKARNVATGILWHAIRERVEGGPQHVEYERFRAAAESRGALFFDDEPQMRQFAARGVDPFRDEGHPNDAGHEALSQTLELAVDALRVK